MPLLARLSACLPQAGSHYIGRSPDRLRTGSVMPVAFPVRTY